MMPDDPSPGQLRPSGGSAFDQFGTEARLEARMLDPDTPITDDQRQALIRELLSYRDNHKVGATGRPMPWEALGEKIGVSGSSLLEVSRGKYKADDSTVLRKVDQFLADERIRLGRFDARSFSRIGLTDKIKGTIEQALKHNAIAVITGEPGSGKSEHARWYVGQREGAILIEPDDFDCDERWVVDAVFAALGLIGAAKFRRDKKRMIVHHLRKHKNTVVVVDESQKLTRSALEMLRRLHDLSDPQGLRNVSVILFGDNDFYKLIVQTRGGGRTPISPQITRRLYPVFRIDVDGCEFDDRGNRIPGSVYKKADIEDITRNKRIRILKDNEAIDWLVRLANMAGFGSLGMAMRCFEVACDLRQAKLVDVEDLRLALTTVEGPEQADVIDEQSGHTLFAVAMAG